MKCSLCENEIQNYTKEFNQLVIDESHIYKLCQDCIDKFMKWQGKKFSNLFPTNLMKKRLKEKEK